MPKVVWRAEFIQIGQRLVTWGSFSQNLLNQYLSGASRTPHGTNALASVAQLQGLTNLIAKFAAQYRRDGPLCSSRARCPESELLQDVFAAWVARRADL